MATEDNYNLLVETLQDNYGDKTAIKNAYCVALVTMVKPLHTASALRTFYDSLMSDMRSLTTLDLPTTRYGDFYVPILLEKLPKKLLTNVLKEYPCANPTIDQLVPAGTAIALPAAATLLISPNRRSLNSLRGQRKFHVASVGLPVPTTHFNVNCLSRIESLQLNPSSCALIVSKGVMLLFSVHRSSDVQFVGNPITLHFMELQVFSDFPSCISQYACCTCFRKHTAW